MPATALLEAAPRTGRTHQILVHLSELGHPLLGDVLYGGKGKGDARVKAVQSRLGRQALHAYRLRLRHPRRGTILELEAPLPLEFQKTLAALRQYRSLVR